MRKYSCYCTAEQTRRAFLLDAPIETIHYSNDYIKRFSKEINEESLLKSNIAIIHNEDGIHAGVIPTAEQMVGWLEEQGLFITIDKSDGGHLFYNILKENEYVCEWNSFSSRSEAIIAAIDAALDYLEKGE